MATRATMTTLINGISDGGKTQASEMRTLLTTLMNECFKLYEVKELDINLTTTPSFITDNFDSSGKGTSSSFDGYAICNGNNGTRNRNGRVAIGYDPLNYPSIGSTGGFKDSVLLNHTHTYRDRYYPENSSSLSGATYKESMNYNGKYGSSGTDTDNNTFLYLDSVTGTPNVSTTSSGTDRNMQPYIVTLFIQRIS